MFVKLIPITGNAHDIVDAHGPIWFVRGRSGQAGFAAHREPGWLVVQARDYTRWVREGDDDYDFFVEPFGSDLSDAEAVELKNKLTERTSSEPKKSRFASVMKNARALAFVVGLIAFIPFVRSQIQAGHSPQYSGLGAVIAAVACYGLFAYGQGKGQAEVWSQIPDMEEALRRKLIEKTARKFQNQVESLSAAGSQGNETVLRTQEFFLAMRETVRKIYESADLLDDKAAVMLRDSILACPSRGDPFDQVQHWLHAWDEACRGSIERLKAIVAVHICECGDLYLDNGELLWRRSYPNQCYCTKFEDSFTLRNSALGGCLDETATMEES